MRAPDLTILLTTAAVALPALAEAQTPDAPIPPGARIRVESWEPGPRTGRLRRLDAGGLLFLPDGGSMPVAYGPEEIEALAVYRGTRSGARRGAGIGAGIGFGLGLFAAIGAQGDDGFYRPPSFGESLLIVAFPTAVAGGIGALIGTAFPVEMWESVAEDRLPWRVGVGPGPAGGANLGVSLLF